MADSIIKNTSEPVKAVTVNITCGVDYSSNLEKVEKVTLRVARDVQKKNEFVDKEAEPSMFFTDFGESNINFVVFIKAIDATKKKIVAHDFIKELKKAFDKEKIEISWPVIKLHKGK